MIHFLNEAVDGPAGKQPRVPHSPEVLQTVGEAEVMSADEVEHRSEDTAQGRRALQTSSSAPRREGHWRGIRCRSRALYARPLTRPVSTTRQCAWTRFIRRWVRSASREGVLPELPWPTLHFQPFPRLWVAEGRFGGQGPALRRFLLLHPTVERRARGGAYFILGDACHRVLVLP